MLLKTIAVFKSDMLSASCEPIKGAPEPGAAAPECAARRGHQRRISVKVTERPRAVYSPNNSGILARLGG